MADFSFPGRCSEAESKFGCLREIGPAASRIRSLHLMPRISRQDECKGKVLLKVREPFCNGEPFSNKEAFIAKRRLFVRALTFYSPSINRKSLMCAFVCHSLSD